MRSKKAALVINPRAGENVAKIVDVLAVLAAADIKAEIALKEYGGHTLELANEAAEEKRDLVIAYGGDGTLNQVVNGVMSAKKSSRSIVGVIPGGTTNVWAGEVGIPTDPVKAALSLVSSEPRKVDIGHVEIQSIAYPEGAASNGKEQKKSKSAPKRGSKSRPHFLLMAGLGIDAAIMQHVSKPLKYRLGPLAVGLSAAKELPAQHPFPLEIRSADKGREGEALWKGEALQVVIGNTRRYANLTEMTPDAYIDDGILDVCIITGGDPLTTLQQLGSLLLRRKPDNLSAEYIRGAHLSITVPASVPMQLDGSTVELKDSLKKADYAALQQAGDAEHVLVTYAFDALRHALALAIPRSYDDELFEHTDNGGKTREDAEDEHAHVKAGVNMQKKDNEGAAPTAVQERALAEEAQPKHKEKEEHADDEQVEADKDDTQQEVPEDIRELLKSGRKITVVGKAPVPESEATYIIAGGTEKASTGETRPVAVVVNGKTTVYNHQGDELQPTAIEELSEGAVIIVEGKKSKRGVIAAARLAV
jgi:YegS/Rv2252/BmrU family lipid kinase